MKKKANRLPMSALISNGFPPLQKTSIKMLFLVFFSASIILVLIAMTGRTYHIPLDKLTSDPAAIAAINPLYGVLSNLGIILWGAATFSCALAAVVLRSMEPKKGYLFLLYSSLLSAYLMLDDLFQFHEDLSSSIGLNQKVIYLFLGTAVIAYLIYFRKILFQTNIIPFLIALAFLFLSIVADTIVYKLYGSQLGNWLYLIEDGAKWIGIVFWAYYFFYTSFQFITGNTGVSNAAK